MEFLSRIGTWLSDHEAMLSAAVAIMVLAGAVFAGLRAVLRRRPEPASEQAPAGSTEAPSAAETPAPDLDPLTVPGFEGRPAIAVLPFDNLSGDPEQEYFADGIAEDLITRLSARRDFPVIARNSSFTYKGKAVDVKQVSRELGVRYVVEGSVRKEEGRVRISGQLIDATTGAHVWAERYDRKLRDVFAVQDEITEAIAGSIYPQLSKSEQDRAARKKPQVPDAWDSYWRAWWHYAKLTKEDNAQARSLFKAATDLDPQFALAFAGLAFTHNEDLVSQWSESPPDSIAELETAARKAVLLDNNEPWGQLALGLYCRFAGQLEKATAAFESAVRLDPSLGAGWYFLAGVLAETGRSEEAIASAEKTIRLSPQDPWMHTYLTTLAFAHVAAGQQQEAIDCAQRSIQRRPDNILSYLVLA